METILFEFLKPWKFHIVSALSFLLCNENVNSFLTRVQKLFKGGTYSREETIRGNTVCKHLLFFTYLGADIGHPLRLLSDKLVQPTPLAFFSFLLLFAGFLRPIKWLLGRYLLSNSLLRGDYGCDVSACTVGTSFVFTKKSNVAK